MNTDENLKAIMAAVSVMENKKLHVGRFDNGDLSLSDLAGTDLKAEAHLTEVGPTVIFTVSSGGTILAKGDLLKSDDGMRNTLYDVLLKMHDLATESERRTAEDARELLLTKASKL